MVSVIMPCFNHAAFLEESVRAVLSQTSKDLELIIIDDASSDQSLAIAGKLAGENSRVVLCANEKNAGVSSARNDGLKAARGEFVAFCDADDIWLPEKLAVQTAILRDNPQVDFTFADAFIIDENGRESGTRFSSQFSPPADGISSLFSALCLTNFINTQTVLMRRRCLESLQGFDKKIRFGEDWWLWVQIARNHLFFYSPQPLAKYRVHSRSTSAAHGRSYPAHRFKVFHRMLEKYPDLPDEIKCRVWYHMGCCLGQAGKRQWATRFFWRALGGTLQSPRTWPLAAWPLWRLARESWKQRK